MSTRFPAYALRRPVGRSAPMFEISPMIWTVCGVLAVAGLISANPLLTAASVLMVPILHALFWREGEPPVLLFCVLMQWLQITIAVFNADFGGNTLLQAYEIPELEQATWLSLLCLLALAAGMRVALLKAFVLPSSALRAELRTYSIPALFRLYIAVVVATSVLGAIAFAVPQLTQFIVSVLHVKWVVVFVLAYAVLQRREEYRLLALVVGIEVLLGVASFFSSFTKVFFVLLIVAAISDTQVKGRIRFAVFPLAALVLVFCVIWAAVKPEYRMFLNKGTGEQAIYVSKVEALSKLGELALDVDGPRLSSAMDDLVKRVAYVDFFSYTMRYVPSVRPHEHGALWLGAIGHVLQPRLLFPNKPALDDSAQTTEYTGIAVAGGEQGTAISLGYYAESYIDFGPWGMAVPIFLLGLLYGWVYRIFASGPPAQRIFGYGIATSVLLAGATQVGLSNAKILGGVLTSLIIMLVLRKYVIGRFTEWIRE